MNKFDLNSNEFDEIFPNNFDLLEYEIISNEKETKLLIQLLKKSIQKI